MRNVAPLLPLVTCAASFMGGEDGDMGGGLITHSTAWAGLGTGLSVERREVCGYG